MRGRKRFTLSFPLQERTEIEEEARRQGIDPTTLIRRWARAGRAQELHGGPSTSNDPRHSKKIEGVLSRICFILELIGDDSAVTSAAIIDTLTPHPERLKAAREYAKRRVGLISRLHGEDGASGKGAGGSGSA